MPKLTQITRESIINLLEEGKSSRKKAKGLHISKLVVNNVRKTVPELGNGSKGGTPSKLTPRSKRLISSYISSQTARTPQQAASILEDSVGISVSAKTVRNVLKEADLKARGKAKKSLLSDRYIRNTFSFALKHQEWTTEDWEKVIWSDETKINRIYSDGIQWSWRRDGQVLREQDVTGTVKFGGGKYNDLGLYELVRTLRNSTHSW